MKKLLSLLAIILLMITTFIGCISEEELRNKIDGLDEEITYNYRNFSKDWGSIQFDFQSWSHWISPDCFWLEYKTDAQIRVYILDTLEENLGDPAKFIRFDGHGSEEGDYIPLVDMVEGHIWVYEKSVVIRPKDDVSWDDIEDDVSDTIQAWIDYQGL